MACKETTKPNNEEIFDSVTECMAHESRLPDALL